MLLGSGITFLIGLQAFINIGVVTGVLPNKGLPLPFISYGGSNLLIMLASVGLLLSIARQAREAEGGMRSDHNGGGSRQPVCPTPTASAMTSSLQRPVRVAIACGGTGGHLFPGLAVADQLVRRGCAVMLLISPKEVDQQAVRGVSGMEVVALPAVGLKRGGEIAFIRGFIQSYRAAAKLFKSWPPQAALAMGGFTGAPPMLAAKTAGARTFLHESNTIPGRANRWLSRVVHRAFVGFPTAGVRLHSRNVTVTGTPVRPCFQAREASGCRVALGLDAARPVLLVMGGSQGASGINELVLRSLPLLANRTPDLQWLHLTGASDLNRVLKAYSALKLKALVHPFFAEMELALGAATAAVCRAGASSLAELAAMRVPAVLVPYPTATGNHQFHNARAFEASGAARLLEQRTATPEMLAQLLSDLIEKPAVHENMRNALAQWHAPRAAEQMAEAILASCGGQGWTGPPRQAPIGFFTRFPNVRDWRESEECRTHARQPVADRSGPDLQNAAAGREVCLSKHDSLEAEAPHNSADGANELEQRVSQTTVIRGSEPLAKHTTLRVGGPADLYVEPGFGTGPGGRPDLLSRA